METLILFKQDGSTKLNHALLDNICEGIDQRPIATVILTGEANSGKSTALNMLCKKLRSATQHSVDSVEKIGPQKQKTLPVGAMALQVWQQPLVKIDEHGKEIAVLLFELHGCRDSASLIEKASLIAVLLSSLLVYNLSHPINSNHFTHVSSFLELVKQYGEKLGQTYMFLTRNTMNSKDCGLEEGKAYLDEILKTNRKSSELSEILNTMEDAFEKLECFIAPRPDKQLMNAKGEIPSKDIGPEFVLHLTNWAEHVAKTVKPKTMMGVMIDKTLFKSFVIKIEEKVKSIEQKDIVSAFEDISTDSLLLAKNTGNEAFNNFLQKISHELSTNPNGKAEIESKLKEAMLVATKAYTSIKCFGSVTARSKAFSSFRFNLTDRCHIFHDQNGDHSVRRTMDSLYLDEVERYKMILKEKAATMSQTDFNKKEYMKMVNKAKQEVLAQLNSKLKQLESQELSNSIQKKLSEDMQAIADRKLNKNLQKAFRSRLLKLVNDGSLQFEQMVKTMLQGTDDIDLVFKKASGKRITDFRNNAKNHSHKFSDDLEENLVLELIAEVISAELKEEIEQSQHFLRLKHDDDLKLQRMEVELKQAAENNEKLKTKYEETINKLKMETVEVTIKAKEMQNMVVREKLLIQRSAQVLDTYMKAFSGDREQEKELADRLLSAEMALQPLKSPNGLREFLYNGGANRCAECESNSDELYMCKMCKFTDVCEGCLGKHAMEHNDDDMENPYVLGLDFRHRHCVDECLCDVCNETIKGYNFSCLTCPDYDLCPSCAATDVHSHHKLVRLPFVLRDSKPMENDDEVSPDLLEDPTTMRRFEFFGKLDRCSECSKVFQEERFSCKSCEFVDLCPGCAFKHKCGLANLRRLACQEITFHCNLCIKSISGWRYACTECGNFDLCEICVEKHPHVCIRLPGRASVLMISNTA